MSEIKERAHAEASREFAPLPGCTTCVEAAGTITRLTRERDEARAEAQAMGLRAVAAEARVKVLAASATDETEARHALRARLARIEAAAREAADLLGVVASEVKGDAASVYGQVRWARDARRVEASIRAALEGGG